MRTITKGSLAPRAGDFDKAYYTTGAYTDYQQDDIVKGKELGQRLIEAIGPRKSWKFLDVGCGLGGLVKAWRESGYMAFGTEVSPYCLENSHAKNWVSKADIRHLPFTDNEFDVVSCIDVVYYLPRREARKAIKEVARVAKRFVYLETIPQGYAMGSQHLNPDDLRQPKYLFTKEELLSVCRQAGLSFVVEVEPGKDSYFSGLFQKKDG